MPKKLIAVTIVRAVFDGVRRDIAPGAEIPEGLSAETLDELKQLGAVREEVVEAPAPVELTGDGSGEAPPEVAAGELHTQATDGGPNPDYIPDADAPPDAPADKPARGKK